MNISPQSLIQAMEKVRAGSLSPQQAALELLQNSDATDATDAVTSAASWSQPITVAELVAQLGPPHPLIQQDWEQQIGQLANQFQQSTGTPIKELTTSDLLVDATNRLTLAPAYFDRWSAQQPQAMTPVAAPEKTVNATAKTQARERTKRSRSTAWKPAASVIGSLALLLLCVWWFGTAWDQTQVAQSTDKIGSGPSITTNAFDLSSSPSHVSSTHRTEPALTNLDVDVDADSELSQPLMLSSDLESTSATASLTEPASIEDSETKGSSASEDRSLLGLDSFAGGSWQSASDVLKAANSDGELVEPDDDASTATAEDESSSLMLAGEASEAAEAELATSTITTSNQVSLPSLVRRSAADRSVAIQLPIRWPFRKCLLKTNGQSDLKLTEKDSVWLVTTDDVSLAQLDEHDEQLQFQWLPDAYKQPAAKQLCNARLVVETGEANQPVAHDLFLRATVTADPLLMGFEQADNKLAWPIQEIPLVTRARWKWEWQLPESVTQHWLEPLAESARRRQSATCRFQSTSDESIAIDTRFDLQLGTRVQLRIRHQLASDHPAMRQPISLTRIRSAVEFCTEQLIQGEATLEQLKAVSTRARTADRPLISEQRQRLELMMSNWQSYRDRLKQYEKLLNDLQQGCYLAASLQVVWEDVPEQSQVIFEIKPPEPQKSSSQQADATDVESPKSDDDGMKPEKPPT